MSSALFQSPSICLPLMAVIILRNTFAPVVLCVRGIWRIRESFGAKPLFYGLRGIIFSRIFPLLEIYTRRRRPSLQKQHPQKLRQLQGYAQYEYVVYTPHKLYTLSFRRTSPVPLFIDNDNDNGRIPSHLLASQIPRDRRFSYMCVDRRVSAYACILYSTYNVRQKVSVWPDLWTGRSFVILFGLYFPSMLYLSLAAAPPPHALVNLFSYLACMLDVLSILESFFPFSFRHQGTIRRWCVSYCILNRSDRISTFIWRWELFNLRHSCTV